MGISPWLPSDALIRAAAAGDVFGERGFEMNIQLASLTRFPHHDRDSYAEGLDGLTVRELLQGAVLKGRDPAHIMEQASIDPAIYANPNAAIDGRSLVRLIRQIQFDLDDIYLGFLPQNSRLALEKERILCLLNSSNFGEALRVSVRFTNAMAPDVGAVISPDYGSGLQHVCGYQTIDGVDRSVLVWIRFVWIYRFFSWLIGRPLKLRALSISGPKPIQSNGFDRFAMFGCPVIYNSSFDALSYDCNDLTRPLIHRSAGDYDDYYAREPDWFESGVNDNSWADRTRNTIIELQREGWWYPSIEMVAERLSTNVRRLRYQLSSEGDNFQDLRTRLRGELASAYLLASDFSIQQIGSELGFSEPGSFSRHFLSWAGVSPSTYRAQHISDVTKISAAATLLVERRAQHLLS